MVEQKVSKSDKYRVEYLTNTNQTGELRLVDVDVVNDLALLESPELERHRMYGTEIGGQQHCP